MSKLESLLQKAAELTETVERMESEYKKREEELMSELAAKEEELKSKKAKLKTLTDSLDIIKEVMDEEVSKKAEAIETARVQAEAKGAITLGEFHALLDGIGYQPNDDTSDDSPTSEHIAAT